MVRKRGLAIKKAKKMGFMKNERERTRERESKRE